ncbi:FAD/NAD(P)-binding domain-containing protein [Phanerochaete sordida]|uniref:FAD/NAD(P)-binding domain-containing protein n=1 Tax=Phanerochaete sordida TaxID=48140 RepID=A0A9P3GEA1_9APHY|nr:FAD/NAD(P)-binding domain-containing protein [Phanerochaete sordida]
MIGIEDALTPHPRLRVAICGAGVAGLTLAAALSRTSDFDVALYDAAPELARAGPAVGLWPRAWQAANAMGLAHALAPAAIVPPDRLVPVAFDFRRGDRAHGGAAAPQLVTPGMISFPRQDFQRALLSLVAGSCGLHPGKRLVSFSQRTSAPEPVQLFFEDGSLATCNVLVGADGVDSTVRACMARAVADELTAAGEAPAAQAALHAARAQWSGTTVYQATVASDALREKSPEHRVLTTPQVYLGKDAELTAYPIARGSRVSIAAFVVRPGSSEEARSDEPHEADAPREELALAFGGWEPEVQALLDCVASARRWAVHTTAPLRSFAHRRVVLLGDAAHAMTPYQGAGAGQAVEDAYILSALLTHPATTAHTAERAAAVYDAVRRPEAQRVAEVSREAGQLYTFNYPDLVPDPESDGEEMLQETYERIRRGWEWAWESSARPDLERAVAMLEGRVPIST